MLEAYIRDRLREKDILLMTHIMLGYPSFDDCFDILGQMVEAGVDIIEMQIPFSEPIADGPVILRANQLALDSGATVKECIDFAENACEAFDIPILFMTYYNIIFRYGVDQFVSAIAENGIKGVIIPDLPPEEGTQYLRAMEQTKLAPIFTFSPTTPDERMQNLASLARGFIYCIARKGVTGTNTSFTQELAQYLARCRNATDLPFAVGFGVKEKKDIDFLKEKADIAVIGTEVIKSIEAKGVISVRDFIRNLAP